MRKSIIVLTTAAGLAILAICSGLWVPALVDYYSANEKLSGAMTTAVQWVLWIVDFVAWVVGVELFRRGAQARQSIIVTNSHAGRDVVNLNVAGDYRITSASPGADNPPRNAALHQLRPVLGDFVGRDTEIQTLLSVLHSAGGAAICGIHGMGGVGKTELALYVTNQIKEDYPDAQLWLDLHGSGPDPMTPAEALSTCIHSLIGLHTQLPEKLEELESLYRSLLVGKCALILLDDVATDAQVRALLPPAGCVLLLTSREGEAMAFEGLKVMQIDQLKPEEAREIVQRIAPRVPPSVAGDIAKLCGNLPLALRAAGSLLKVTPDLDPTKYVTALSNERKRLEVIGRTGVRISVEASLSLSYYRLSTDAKRVFSELSVFSGSFDSDAEEAVCQDYQHTELSGLVRHSLVQFDTSSNRYQLHDLVRLFGGASLNVPERIAAERRHSTYFAKVAAIADSLYLQGADRVAQGLMLFDSEWENIQMGQAWAAQQTNEDDAAAKLCSQYVGDANHCLNLRLPPHRRLEWLKAAITAAQRLKDRSAEVRHLAFFGQTYIALGEPRPAIEHLQKAFAISETQGDPQGEARVLRALGHAHLALGESDRSRQFFERSLALTRKNEDRRYEGLVLGSLASAFFHEARTSRAIGLFEKAITIHREFGDLHAEAGNSVNLGNAYESQGDYDRAQKLYKHSLRLSREIGDLIFEANALGSLGNAYKISGKFAKAIDHYGQAIAIHRRFGDRRGEAACLANLADLMEKLGDRPEAIANLRSALEIYESMEDPGAEKMRDKLDEWEK